MPRFAILRHESPRGLHWDLLLEAGGVLRTWALERSPDATGEIPCQKLADHRLAYLEYEGPVSGARGSVTRWDRGTYRVERESDNELAVELTGERLNGLANLRRSAEGAGRWLVSVTLGPPNSEDSAS